MYLRKIGETGSLISGRKVPFPVFYGGQKVVEVSFLVFRSEES